MPIDGTSTNIRYRRRRSSYVDGGWCKAGAGEAARESVQGCGGSDEIHVSRQSPKRSAYWSGGTHEMPAISVG